jgi:tRNA (cytidine/uridine-2'-O-)-methyltransferase
VLHIVLFEPEIHSNTGNIGRTCVALQAKLWLVRPLGFRLDDTHLHRAGLDYWEHLQLEVVENWAALISSFPKFQPWFFTKTADKLYTEAQFSRDDVLVFGSETRGLPPGILADNPDRCLRIPMHQQVRSLNLAVSVGIAAYEATRQITKDGGLD